MKSAALLLSLLLAACASTPPMPPPQDLFRDELFAAPSQPIDADSALAVSDAMRRYVAMRVPRNSRSDDRRRLLIEALYQRGDLQLEYDAAYTRTASQAFAARSGNCLALVMMTGALAREMGLTVRYQSVVGGEGWERSGDLAIAVGHVSLTLSERQPLTSFGATDTDAMTVDFVPPPRDSRGPRTHVVSERTIVAMYLTNRAVESLTSGQPDDAYWWAREAIRRDPELLSAYLALAVIYRGRQQPQLADAALRRVIEREPGNTMALSNRVLVLHDLGRHADAARLAADLARLDPHPPFSYFQQGLAAMQAHRYDEARRLFAKEVDRAPYHAEFQFWLAVSYLQLNDPAHAAAYLKRAVTVSTTRKERELYASKLAHLQALTAH